MGKFRTFAEGKPIVVLRDAHQLARVLLHHDLPRRRVLPENRAAVVDHERRHVYRSRVRPGPQVIHGFDFGKEPVVHVFFGEGK